MNSAVRMARALNKVMQRKGQVFSDRYHLHLLRSRHFMSGLSLLSRLNAASDFIEALREDGRNRASAWLRKRFKMPGARSTFALDGLLN